MSDLLDIYNDQEEFELVTCYKCTKCGRFWEEKPVKCKCRVKFKAGEQVGAFKLIEKLSPKRWRVRCKICSVDTAIYVSNLRKQKTCGCSPHHVMILETKENTVVYECRLCQTQYEKEYPVLSWCDCNE